MRTPLLKRIAIGCVITLLLIAGYAWIQRVPAESPSALIAADTTTITAAPDTTTIDMASATTKPMLKKTPIPPALARAVKQGTPADRPAIIEEELASEEAVEKPAPVTCDQVVMRNGDLTDAKILEVGVNEIRYRKRHRDDGPEYVVSKSDVLSIRYANGDIDRF